MTPALARPIHPRPAALALLLFLGGAALGPVRADVRAIPPAPERAEGRGPFARLILRGPILVDGSGAPARGPVDIVIEGNRIAAVETAGSPGAPADPGERPEAGPGDEVLELDGHYVLPGFIDLHGHMGGVEQGTPAEYVFKLWLGHGITTIRDPGSGNGLDWALRHKERSDRNEITAPRIEAYVFFGQGRDEPFTAPEQAREWVREVARRGADGVKLFGGRPEIVAAAIEEAAARGLRTACHHSQLAVTRVGVLDTAGWGLTTAEHWYGIPEALFTDRTVQAYPPGYNYLDERHRFAEAGQLWRQAAPPGSERWNRLIEELVALDLTLDPTLTIYEATRDLMRARRAEWHDLYTLPALWDFFRPSRESHGSFWYHWTSADEVAWRDNYRLWMRFLDDFKNRGGRVTTGSDAGYLYKLYGFAYVRELELLQEAGFHPLEVVRAATLHGAEALGLAADLGTVEPGKLADLVIVAENPLADFKVLYGTGAIRLDPENRPIRVGGVRYTLKDGILFDASSLLADVRRLVAEAKANPTAPLPQPGLEPPVFEPSVP